MKKVLLVFTLSLIVSDLPAADAPLFPRPIHLTRVVSDPVSGSSTTIDEYLIGDRVVSVSGSRTAIADYAASQLVVIDRARGTFSATSFADLARVNASRAAVRAADVANRWKFTDGSSMATSDGGWREARARDGSAAIVVRRDPSITLSRAAAEVILGIAYPGMPNEHDAVTLMLSKSGDVTASSGAGTELALPVEIRITYLAEGENLEATNRVTRIGFEEPSPELLAIPAGATRVEHPKAALPRELSEADHLPRKNQ